MTTYCISEMFGEVEATKLIEYVDKNWKTINYTHVIDNMLKKFKESLEVRGRNSPYRKKYECIKQSWCKFTSEDHGETVSGHFISCRGAGSCRCTYILFDTPRTYITWIINDYYPVQCITQMINGCEFNYVMSYFEKNWRRMDELDTIMEKLLKMLLLIIGRVAKYQYLNDRYTYYFSESAEWNISHDPGCKNEFFDGLLECRCFHVQYYGKAKAFIKEIVELYYSHKM